MNKYPLPEAVVWSIVLLSALLLLLAGVQPAAVYLFGPELSRETKLALGPMVISLLGFGGALSAFGFALYQFRRAEQWKRAEFIANEIKAMEAERLVQNTQTMIDWGHRRINLFALTEPKHSDYIEVTREMQWQALLPHPVKQLYNEDQASNNPHRDTATFTSIEARIRDNYDFYLTRLDRLATFVKSGLFTAAELEPFISYWIEVISKAENSEKDGPWRAALLTYINYYNYAGVLHLFECYGKNIRPNGTLFQEVLRAQPNRKLAQRLLAALDAKQLLASPPKHKR